MIEQSTGHVQVKNIACLEHVLFIIYIYIYTVFSVNYTMSFNQLARKQEACEGCLWMK